MDHGPLQQWCFSVMYITVSKYSNFTAILVSNILLQFQSITEIKEQLFPSTIPQTIGQCKRVLHHNRSISGISVPKSSVFLTLCGGSSPRSKIYVAYFVLILEFFWQFQFYTKGLLRLELSLMEHKVVTILG